jgi:hypothetical protein
MNERRVKESKEAIDTEQGEKEPEKTKREPIVKSKVGRTFIWIGVLLLAGAAVSTRNLILIILASLAPFIAGIFTAEIRVRK